MQKAERKVDHIFRFTGGDMLSTTTDRRFPLPAKTLSDSNGLLTL